MPLLIGTSGWQYKHWRGRLHEGGLPTARWLERYAEAFDTVELNVTFYRQPRPSVFEGWSRRAPEGFLFAVKASRFLTHIRRLREPRDSVNPGTTTTTGAHRTTRRASRCSRVVPACQSVVPRRQNPCPWADSAWSHDRVIASGHRLAP